MRILDWLYLTEASAVEYGMTHEGRLFGVPAWLTITGENEVLGAPKVPILQLWCILIDRLMDAACWLIPEDVEVATPVFVGRSIVVQD